MEVSGIFAEEDKVREQIERALKQIRLSLQAGEGDVQLVDVKDGIVKVKSKEVRVSDARCPR